MFAVLAGSWAVAAKYVYDGNGRLVVVTNEGGQSARYVYDKLGNLLRIERLAADELAVFGFSPTRGGVGLPVMIEGQGFSATPSANQVAFNGTAATVTAATATELVAQVPAGASTGPVTVTVGAQTATGPVDFVVDEDAQPPVITGVSPLIVSAGTAVTVTGDRLYPTPDQTQVSLNGRLALPSAITNTQLTFPFPTKTGSGKVSVRTPYGHAISAQDVIVAPSGIALGDIVPAGRLVMDAPVQTVSTSTSNQRVALLLDGTNGLMTSLQFSNITGSVSYTLYGPNNLAVVSNSVSPTSPSVHLPKLTTATYLLLMKPNAAPASWNVAWEKNKVVGPDALAFATAVSYQTKRLVFSAAQGQSVGLGISDLATPGSTNTAMVYVYRPDGVQANYQYCYASNGGCDVNLPNLAVGMYSVVVVPPVNAAGMSFKATLSADMAATLEPDVVYDLNLARRGQNARLTFAGTVGQTMALQVGAQTTVPTNRAVHYQVYKPDGTPLQGASTTLGLTFNLVNLPATGMYTVTVDPAYGSAATAQMRLATGTSEGAVVNGAGGTYATVAGQDAYFTFAATQGQNLGLGISDLVMQGASSNEYTTVYVYGPTGAQVIYQSCYVQYGGCGLNLQNLAAGRYSVLVRASTIGDKTLSFKATLSTDVVATLEPDTVYDLGLGRRGQNGRLIFTGTVGQTVALQVGAQTTEPAGKAVYYTVYMPDGNILTSTSDASTTILPNLATTGSYQVFVDPDDGAAVTVKVTLSTGTAGGMSVDSSSGTYTSAFPDQSVYLSFTATAGQNLGLGISDLAITGGTDGYINVDVYAPDGGLLSRSACLLEDGGCDLNLSDLSAGTYSVIAQPTGSDQTISFKATLSSDVSGVLAPGATYNMTLNRRGQNARLTFAGAENQAVALRITEQSTTTVGRNVAYTVHDPDGYEIKSDTATTGRILYLIDPLLPQTGTYTVFVDPALGDTVIAQIQLDTNVTLSATGNSLSFNSVVGGDSGQFAFEIAEGESLGIDVGALVTPGTTDPATVEVHRPNGSWVYRQCTAASGGCGFDLTGYAAGPYWLAVVPPESGDGTVSFTATLSAAFSGTLQANLPTVVNLARRGQKARLEFSATAGQSLSIVASDQTTSPAGLAMYYRINKPDGSLLRGIFSTTTGITIHQPNLPSTGTYSVLVETASGTTGTARVELNTGGTLSVGGSAVAFTSAAAWERSYTTFNLTATTSLKLRTTQMATPGTTSPARIEVHNPGSSSYTYNTCAAGTATCTLTLSNLAPGTYGVVVHPPASGSGNMSFSQTLSTQ